MKIISDQQIEERIRFENPWWESPHEIDPEWRRLGKRAYFGLFYRFVQQEKPRRAIILMGPRRVGKTVMMHQVIQELIDSGVKPTRICYLNLETPLYNGTDLERLIKMAQTASGCRSGQFFLFFDEIQYLKEWEVHLKTAVDAFRNMRFFASGSSAAALRLKSNESGAGRFTDFLLPPVTFYEYLLLLNKTNLVSNIGEGNEDGSGDFTCEDIGALNREFENYLNFGGYPEAIFDPTIQKNPGQYIRRDVIDKVLLRDLPSLYGIYDVQELNSLFTMLAYNTAEEVSLEGISQNSGVAKNTIKKYIEYLESAFLIRTVHRVDESARKFKRANFYKVYLTNPCMRSALFSPLTVDDEGFGYLVETAVYSQWFHSDMLNIYYSRWKNGEVDIVHLDDLRPIWAIEVKWSDRFAKNVQELKSLRRFLKNHRKCEAHVTTRTISCRGKIEGRVVTFEPASLYCFTVGYNIINSKSSPRELQARSKK